MKSTGEVMGIDNDFGRAFAKAQMAAGQTLPMPPREGSSKNKIFLSVSDRDKRKAVQLARHLVRLGFTIVTTAGTHKTLARHGIQAEIVKKISEGRPNMLDLVKNGDIGLVINTPTGKGHHTDEAKIRTAMVSHNIPCITTIAGAEAAVTGIESMLSGYTVRALQDYNADVAAKR
jgi:carbamoyl-phosphate synthase large subunit